MKRLLASPALHFFVIGAVLYFTQGVWNPIAAHQAGPERPAEIVVGPITIGELRDNFRKTTGRNPVGPEEDALVRDYADREILYREALARGLDKGDRSVKWRLIQKMHFLEGREDDDPDTLYQEALELGLDREDIVIRRLLIEKMRLLIKLGAVNKPPDESEVLDFYERNAEDYRQPSRVSLRHVFLSTDKRKGETFADAARLLEKVRAESIDPDAAVKLGDVFALGHTFRTNSEHNLAKLLGPDFAKVAIGLSPGGWHGPVRSAYGFHLVWVDERQDSTLPGLNPVRNQVLQRYLAELRDAVLNEEMRQLRERYAVSVADALETNG